MPENEHPDGPLELRPLLIAVEKVLAGLGKTSLQDDRFQKTVAELEQQYKKYRDCCFFAQVVKGKKE